MKDKIITSFKEVEHDGKKYSVFVYGELTEAKEINGFYVIPVSYNGKNKKIKDVAMHKRTIVPGFDQYSSKTKYFNMGWSICVEPDVFDYETGVELCKRRFSRSPMTTQNGRFLTPDMCQAIVNNEVEFIIRNIDKYLPKVKTKVETKKIDDDNNFNEEVFLKHGDYVSFVHENIKYVGIFKEYGSDNFFFGPTNMHFYFLGSVTNKGLVDHDNILFFSSVSGNVKLQKANDSERELINAYLRGAHNREWDANSKTFKLIVG